MNDGCHLEDDAQFFRDLLLPTPPGAATLDEMADGFTEQRAQQVLGNPHLLSQLKLLAARIEPGFGWMMQALSGEAPASAELYFLALDERPDNTAEIIAIVRDRDATLFRPERLDYLDPDVLARVELPGGWAAWHPAEPDGLPFVGFDSPVIPTWVPILLGSQALNDLAAGHKETRFETILNEPHPLGRYALGQWLRRHSMPALPESVLRVELGALAYEHADFLGGTDTAQELLADAGPVLIRLFEIVASWETPRRTLAETDLRRATASVLSLDPDIPEAASLTHLLADGVSPSLIDPGSVPDAFALAADGELPADQINPLIEMVTKARLEAIERLADEVGGAEDNPGRPFIAELIIFPEIS